MSRFRKTLIIALGTTVAIIALVILFASPLVKYLIEKYDKVYIGREITLDRAYVNPFTGFVHLSNVRIFEPKSDSVLLYSKGLSGNFTLYKLFNRTCEITKVVFDEPRGIIAQEGDKQDLNFKDLIHLFSGKSNQSPGDDKFRVSIHSLLINDGEFHYRENMVPINYHIIKTNINCSGILWNSDTLAFTFDFLDGHRKGAMEGNCTINTRNLDYHLSVKAKKYDLEIIRQYLRALTNDGNFTANIDAAVNARGNFRAREQITTKGLVTINDFHFGKNKAEDYASFTKLALAIKELSPLNKKYLFDSVSLTHPYLKYERYDYLDNVQAMFGAKGAMISKASSDPVVFNLVIAIARYIKALSENFLRSNYNIRRLAVYNGNLEFNDYSLSEKFSTHLDPLYISADSIDKTRDRVKLKLTSGVTPFGDLKLVLNINPRDESDFNMRYHLQNIPLAHFNPYLVTFTSFPMNRGSLELKGKWIVREGLIFSDNHLLILDPRLCRRLRNKDLKWIPLPLAMSLVRERGNVIDYDIPIRGSLKNPDFHWRDVVLDLVKNIFVKPATTPYRLKVNNVETDIEASFGVTWQLRQTELLPENEKFIRKIADFLAENPGASIVVSPQTYAIKEKEYILFYEAKKKYYLSTHQLSEKTFGQSDSEAVNYMSVKDTLFELYLNKYSKGRQLYTIQEKCALIVDPAFLEAKLKKLTEQRLITFIRYFKEKAVNKQVKVMSAKNVVPYNGFSFFSIKYDGETPPDLLEAYSDLMELNDRAPRNKYKKARKKNAHLL